MIDRAAAPAPVIELVVKRKPIALTYIAAVEEYLRGILS